MDTPNPTPSTISIPSAPNMATRLRNLFIVLVAVMLSVTLFLGLRTQASTVSLDTMAKNTTPLEVALTNGKPTFLEFYANWCTTCQAMAGELNELKQAYSDRVNFVMLNVDNTKWLPEIVKYRVDGIPHFVFFDAQGGAIASTIGEQPQAVFAADLEAIIAGNPLPQNQGQGSVSAFTAPVSPQGATDPRSHGSQVKS